MSLISEDLMQQNQNKIKSFSREFLQRYLNGIAEFIKTDLDVPKNQDENEDFTCQMFSIWKFMI
jgi:hypothetical protein